MRGGGTRVPRPDVRAGVRSARGPRDRVGGGGVRRSPCRSRRARRRRACGHYWGGLRPGTGWRWAASAGALAARGGLGDGEQAVTIEQGYEMGRPSLIELAFVLRAGKVVSGPGGGG